MKPCGECLAYNAGIYTAARIMRAIEGIDGRYGAMRKPSEQALAMTGPTSRNRCADATGSGPLRQTSAKVIKTAWSRRIPQAAPQKAMAKMWRCGIRRASTTAPATADNVSHFHHDDISNHPKSSGTRQIDAVESENCP